MLTYYFIVGISTITCDDDNNCTPDKCMPTAPEFVNIYLVFNQFYNLLIILILKYGSANLLYLALTLMVPLGNVTFTLPFVPQSGPLRPTDIIGLVVICFGLGCYRFAADLVSLYFSRGGEDGKTYEKLQDGDNKKVSLVSHLLTVEEADEENEETENQLIK